MPAGAQVAGAAEGVAGEGAGLPALLDLRGAAMTSYYLDNDAAVAALVNLYSLAQVQGQGQSQVHGQGQGQVGSDGAASATRGAQLEASARVRARLEVGSNGLTTGQICRLQRACGDAFVLTVDDAEVATSDALLFEWNDCVAS